MPGLESQMEKLSISADKLEYVVYDNDPALGSDLPSLEGLEYFTHEDGAGVPTEFKYDVNSEEPLVLTFTNKLNVADFKYLNEIEKLEGAKKLAIARDPSVDEVKSFCRKYVKQEKEFAQHNFTLFFDFPVAFDKDSAVNQAFKSVLKKAVVGVGMTFIVLKGKIVWYEYFVRGESVMGQFQEQFARVLRGEKLLSNGLAPEEEEEEDELAGETVKIDADPFGGNDDY